MTPRVRLIEPEDRSAVLRIWDEQFGGGGARAEGWLDEATDDRFETVGFVAADGDPVGFLVAGIGGPAYVSDYVRGALDPDGLPDETAVLHMLCVDDGWKGRGIGTRLVETCLCWSRPRVDLVVAVSWQRDGHVDSTPLFEKFGFERVETIERYYFGYRDDCPDCDGECTCSAAVYAKRLSEGD